MKDVKSYYREQGWQTHQGVTQDALLNEDLRPCAQDYVSKCRRRVQAHIPPSGQAILDMASGPIQYPEYLDYSKGYEQRVCVDLSHQALKDAETKIGQHGRFICGDFLELDFEEQRFDCIVSLHTLYHIDFQRQAEAVHKLLKLIKPGAPLIVVSKNPKPLIHYPLRLFRFFIPSKDSIQLYHEAPVLHWWKQFEDLAEIKYYPWRSFSSRHQTCFFPNNFIGRMMFKVLYGLENLFPKFFVRWGKFPMIVLKKKL